MIHRKLSDAAEEYLQLTAGRYAATSNKNREGAIRRFIKRTGDIQVRHLSQRHMEEYFYAKPHGMTSSHAPRSVNLTRTLITGWVRFMQNRGWLTCDPMVNIRPAKVVKRERVRLSAEELLECLELATHPRDRAFLALAINTGLRVSEITDLKVGDVNLDLSELRVRVHKSFTEDTFPINSDLDTELRRWLTYYAGRVALQPGHYLVPAKDPWLANGKNGVPCAAEVDVALHPDRRMAYPLHLKNELFRKLGIDPKGEGIHTFRRSVARVYYDAMLQEEGSRDEAIRLTQNLLHHASLVTTEHYLGMTREREQRDASLKGQPFLSKIHKGDNVVPIRGVSDAGV